MTVQYSHLLSLCQFSAPFTMHQPSHPSTDNSKLPRNSTNTYSTDQGHAKHFFKILHWKKRKQYVYDGISNVMLKQPSTCIQLQFMVFYNYLPEKRIIAVWKMNDVLPLCHQKPMCKQTVPNQGYAQSVSTDAGRVKCLPMFIWRKLTCCSLIRCHSFFVVDDQVLHVSCRGHRVTLTLTLNKGGRSSPWANGLDFWKICHTVENVEHRNGNLFEVSELNVAVRRSTVPAPAGQRAERQRNWDQVPLLLPPSQIRFFGAASTSSNRSRGRYRCGEERVTVAKRGLR